MCVSYSDFLIHHGTQLLACLCDPSIGRNKWKFFTSSGHRLFPQMSFMVDHFIGRTIFRHDDKRGKLEKLSGSGLTKNECICVYICMYFCIVYPCAHYCVFIKQRNIKYMNLKIFLRYKYAQYRL